MKRTALFLAIALAAGGCTGAGEEEQLENTIRENLSNQATVLEVDLTRQDENNLTGYAQIRETSGREGRLNCTATRSEGSNFNWRCSPAIDEPTLQEMETQIRQELANRAEVVEVDMRRAGDDNHMEGHAVVADGAGNQLRLNCTAERTEGNRFNWECNPQEGGN